jgi:hypothetical protein
MAFLPTSILWGAFLNRRYPSKTICRQSSCQGAVGLITTRPLATLPRRLSSVAIMVISGPISATPLHSPVCIVSVVFTGWNAQKGAELPHPI